MKKFQQIREEILLERILDMDITVKRGGTTRAENIKVLEKPSNLLSLFSFARSFEVDMIRGLIDVDTAESWWWEAFSGILHDDLEDAMGVQRNVMPHLYYTTDDKHNIQWIPRGGAYAQPVLTEKTYKWLTQRMKIKTLNHTPVEKFKP